MDPLISSQAESELWDQSNGLTEHDAYRYQRAWVDANEDMKTMLREKLNKDPNCVHDSEYRLSKFCELIYEYIIKNNK